MQECTNEKGRKKQMKNIKRKISQKIVKAATAQAHNTVGKSFPLGFHEVEVPKELKHLTENHEANK